MFRSYRKAKQAMTLKKTVTQRRKPQATNNYAAKYNYASAQTNNIEDEEEKEEEAAFNICSNLSRIIASLHAKISMTDLGLLNYFLGVSVTRNTSGMFLSQQKYATEVLERAGMLTCNPCRTPVDTDSKLAAAGDPVSDPTLYRRLAGALQYLTFTRPDISYAVQQVCLFMHDPREPHFSALKRILWYVRGTLTFGLQLYSSTTSSLVAYSDADWAGCPTTRRSTSGYLARLVLRNLLRELHTPLSTATIVYCDNVSAIYLSSNPVQHQRTKHIEIDIHFVRDLVTTGHIRVLHVPSL
ncbi:ribonuclease H-like domain-containing protein [Tanacetum coccineum]